MAQSKAGEFEESLNKLDEIVKKLEGDEIPLDESVRLFREGKRLASRCEELLKAAQDSIEQVSRGESNGAAGSGGPTDENARGEDIPF
jgi:exodeoxyribonuclease VII small subunit